jgi:putative aldouronate transport system substrate-binding protein
MNMKKTILKVCTLLMALSLIAGCTSPTPAATTTAAAVTTAAPVVAEPLGKYDPPIKIKTMLNSIDPTIKFENGDSPENNVWTRAYKDELGIELEFVWTGNSEQGGEKLNLAISSGDLPDIFYVNPLQFESLANAGKLAEITTAYNDYGGPFMKDVLTRPGSDAALKICSRDGKMYALPYFLNNTDDTKNIWLRYDWMQKLGLKEPKTLQDVLAIAEAFVSKDPDGNGQADTVGIALDTNAVSAYSASLTTFLNCWHAYSGIWVKGSDGKLVFGTAQAEPMKNALSSLAGLVGKKIIDKNFASLKWDENVLPLITDNKVGVIFGGLWDGWWPLGDMKKADPNCEWRSYPVLSADGSPAKAQSHTILMMRMNVVNANFKHPEAMIKMANLCNEKMWKSTPETFAKYGYDAAGNNPWLLMPVYFEYPGKNLSLYQKTVKALETKDTSGLNGEDTLIYNWMVDYRDKADLSRWGIWLSYGPNSSCSKMEYYQKNDLYQLNAFYGNPPQSLLDNSAVLEKLYADYALKIINGEYPVDKYDEFISEWYKQGGQKITDDINAWYAKYK